MEREKATIFKVLHEIGPLCVELIKAAPARLEGQQLLVLSAVIK